jgi:hypothetical protein
MEVLLSEKLGKAGSTGMVSSTKFIYFSEKKDHSCFRQICKVGVERTQLLLFKYGEMR